MAEQPRKILICSCEDTMPLDARRVRRGCRGAEVIDRRVSSAAPSSSGFAPPPPTGEPLTVGCTQEAPLFSEVADETADAAPLTFVNIRETAGWSEGRARPGRRWRR